MPGKWRRRGFISGGGRKSQDGKSAPTPPFGVAQYLVSEEGSADRCCASSNVNGNEKRKSDVIPPLLPVDGVGEVKRREPGRASNFN